VSEIFAYYTERTLGSFVEHKRASITWHYRLADPDYGSFQAKECQNHLEDAIISKLPVEVMVGKKNLEVRPIAINKGEIVRRLLAARQGTDFVFCVGDDRTDEDMFRALLPHPQGDALGDSTAAGARFTCTVGPTGKKTSAAWHVNTPGHVITLLGTWAGTGDTPLSPPQATIEVEE
ncbi:threalose-6-phosphate phosphatase, partial [Cladochytrium tenue]